MAHKMDFYSSYFYSCSSVCSLTTEAAKQCSIFICYISKEANIYVQYVNIDSKYIHGII